MKCSICGGELHFENGVAICTSCKSQHKIDQVFENIDVNICYIESDSAGRRTKDSIIAQDLYQKLEAKKINTFYERISAANIIGDDLEILRYSLLHKVKIVIVVGTNAENFKSILSRYGQHFAGKIVIPVFADVSPSDIPKELSKYQALNHSSIGWEKDLEQAILRILGREKEIDILQMHDKRKKLCMIICIIVASLLIVVGVLMFFYFSSSDDTHNTETETATVPRLTNQQIYEKAQDLAETGEYLNAIEAYTEIVNYKDASNQIKKIYDRYDGYYQDEDKKCSLYLNMLDGKSADVYFEKTVDKKIVRLEESLILSDNQMDGRYIDNLSNEGNVSIKLYNDKVNVKVITDVANAEISIGEVSLEFQLKNKSDRPPIKTVTKEMVLDWVTNVTSVDDIKSAGYELEYIDTTGPYDISFGTQYKIVNSDITIITTNIDLINNYAQFDESSLLDEYVVAAVIGPVDLLCPEKIGQSSCVFTENHKLFVPYAYNLTGPNNSFSSESYLRFLVNSNINEIGNEEVVLPSCTITKDCTVGVTSKSILGSKHYDYLLNIHNNMYYRTIGKE